MRRDFAALVLLALASPAHAAEVDGRRSELAIDPDLAWRETGFRMQLGLGYEWTQKLVEAPGWRSVVVLVEPGVRLSERWSLSVPIRYTVVTGAEYDGLRWNAAPQLGYHVGDHTQLAVGLGYAGVIAEKSVFYVGGSGGAPTELTSKPAAATAALPVARQDCTGDGLMAHTRATYLWHSGELFAHGPAVQADAQLLRCQTKHDGGEGGTATPAHYWSQYSIGFVWVFAWR